MVLVFVDVVAPVVGCGGSVSVPALIADFIILIILMQRFLFYKKQKILSKEIFFHFYYIYFFNVAISDNLCK